MIAGVKVKLIKKHPDDRGYLAEITRADDGFLQRFGQATITCCYPGIIKAFHYHEKQDDLWFFVAGNAQVVLYDLRSSSPTAGQTDVYYMGEDHPLVLLIPKGVAHGYRVLGEKSATLLYLTTVPYNPECPDEKRIPYDDPTIGFCWETRFR